MTSHSENDLQIREYLLGNLSEEDQRLVDERLLTESGFLDEVLAGEDDLIDDYVCDDLSQENRSGFEQHFLCAPERQQKLKFAIALNRYAAKAERRDEFEAPEDRTEDLPTPLTWGERFRAFWNGLTPAFRYASIFAVIALGVAIILVAIPKTIAPKTFATVTLSLSSSNRADSAIATKVNLAQNIDALKAILTLPSLPVPARGYRVELIDSEGQTRPVEVLTKDANTLTVVIPAKRLARGEYALRLYVANADGVEQRINGGYLFVVE